MWYHRKIGGERCPIVDTWWQTETGGIMMSRCRGDSHQAGQLHQAAAGHRARDRRRRRQAGRPPIRAAGWSSAALARHAPRHLGRRRALQEQYWSKVPGKYLAGDNARCDEDGYYWIMGRIDDVLNVSGHRLSTIEVESALVSHPAWPKPPPSAARRIKGEAVAVFVTLKAASRATSCAKN
jgi:acetyl-CoA synthetase